MRVTNSMMVNNMLKNLSKNTKDLDKLNQQLASGKQFTQFSDDPISASKSLDFDFKISNYEQYQENANSAENWLKTTENSIADSNKIMQRASELAVYGSNDTLTANDRKDLAQEVKELRNELIDIANGKLGSDYLFSGQALDQKPITVDSNYTFDPTNLDQSYVEYKGDQNNILRQINDDSKLDVNINAKEAFMDNINTLNNLYHELEQGNNGDEISKYIKDVNDGIDKNSGIRASIGAKINRMELVNKRFEDNLFNLKKLSSENEDIDIAEVVMNLKMKENVYRASLSSASRVIQPSLVDFLK